MNHPMDLTADHIFNLLERCPTVITTMLRLARYHLTGKCERTYEEWTCDEFVDAHQLVFAHFNIRMENVFPYKSAMYRQICNTDVYQNDEWILDSGERRDERTSVQQAIVRFITDDGWGSFGPGSNAYNDQYPLLNAFVNVVPFLETYRDAVSSGKYAPHSVPTNLMFAQYAECVFNHILIVTQDRAFKIERVLA